MITADEWSIIDKMYRCECAPCTWRRDTLNKLKLDHSKLKDLLREVQRQHSRALIELPPGLEQEIIEAIGPHPRDVLSDG